MELRIRYAQTAGGVKIAFWTLGEAGHTGLAPAGGDETSTE